MALLVCVPIYFGAFISREIHVSLAFIFFGNLALASFMAPTMATTQNMAGPRMRATTSAVTALAIGILGAGLGPTVAGISSDLLASRFFEGGDFLVSCPGGRGSDGVGTALDAACLAASTDGLRYSLIGLLVLFLWAALHYLLAARHLQKDLYDPEAETQAAPPEGEEP